LGRRGGVETMTPQEIRQQAAKHFRKLSAASGVNLAQFKAQASEEAMVDLLVGFAHDISVATSLRRQCALDVITIARGPQSPWYHDGKTIDPQAIGETGKTVGHEIEEARKTSALYTQLDELIRSNTDPRLWPDSVRVLAGEMLPTLEASFAEDETGQ
jgi:hypothetical protein